MESVILVDENDMELGTMEKMEAHRRGLLHRAFSVLLFNSNGELLIQKRSSFKYHSAGLWTNTCCSHPLPDETMEHAIERKLMQEMSISAQTIFAYKFLYKTELDNGLIEHEYDHVFIGTHDSDPVINTDEVEDWKFISLPELQKNINTNPEQYTFWFKLITANPEFKAITASIV